MTMPTQCLHGQRLRRHRVCVVNDYFSICPRSQGLHGPTIFENIELNFLLLLLLVFFPN